MKGFTVMDN